MTSNWLHAAGADVVLALHVQPGAKKTEVAGQHGGALKIRLGAPPVDGKANDCLIDFLSDRLRVPKSRITLEAGATSRTKRVRVADMTVKATVERLA